MRRLLLLALLLGLPLAASAQMISASGPCPTRGIPLNIGMDCYRTDTNTHYRWIGSPPVWTVVQSYDPTVGAGGVMGPPSVLFANLPATANGSLLFCSNCTSNTNPCTGSGTGALAVRLNGAWRCLAP